MHHTAIHLDYTSHFTPRKVLKQREESILGTATKISITNSAVVANLTTSTIIALHARRAGEREFSSRQDDSTPSASCLCRYIILEFRGRRDFVVVQLVVQLVIVWLVV